MYESNVDELGPILAKEPGLRLVIRRSHASDALVFSLGEGGRSFDTVLTK